MILVDVMVIFKRLWCMRIVRHVCYWLLTYMVLYVSVLIYDTPTLALAMATFIVAPGPVPVYLNFVALKMLFERRRYTSYFVALIVITVGSAVLIEFVFYLIEQDPDSHISGIGVALFYIAVTTGLKYFARGLRQQFRLQEAEVQQARAELALLRSQVNPHFFFNTLNSLYALSLDRSERVPDMILKLSDLMRYVLDSSLRDDVALEAEIAFIENYVDLERLRLSGNPNIRVDVEGDLKGRRIAPMLLAPFVENGFKHGINAAMHDGYLHIRADVRDNELEYAVENSRAVGSDVTDGMGLKNVRRRLELLYPGAHDLSIQDENDRFRVELRIRL